MWTTQLCVCLLFIASVSARVRDEPEYLEFAERVLDLTLQIHSDPNLKAKWQEHVELYKELDVPIPIFDCDVDEDDDHVPSNVHELKPKDISVIAAFGDSITAANGLGARNLIEVLFENRGESWSVGGDESLEDGVVTLTNFLRKYNPEIKGYSRCQTTSDHHSGKGGFNVARGGGTNRNMPGQADDLIERLKNDSRIDFENDWKMVTLFVGGNDLCGSCNRWDRYDPVIYEKNIEEAMQKLYDNVPRVFVNLVAMFDVTPLRNLSVTVICEIAQWGFCDCARNESTIPQLRQTQLAYYEALKNIAEGGKFEKDDFTIVLQPFMRDMEPPKDSEGEYIPEFLSYDCFHPGRAAHQSFAYWLWENLLIPVGEKPYTMDNSLPEEPQYLSCPSQEHPYFFTNLNSDVEWKQTKKNELRDKMGPNIIAKDPRRG
ncbi:hypothetical protein CAPTEDRAFT_188389 [Capitella teleta]|uniref:Phospholipase B1, membrane-associated n=1 Tax=Capitella teleta TaxID=283909 RepID=R7TSI7_CAPTE|nr:hypothetical protein CAPTEDRAFT_188389 [Capitella teleta]|eukprot:ELT96572.1 hypothetical protein CAPTEDRAFT_188389 [Capitella teleta]